MIRASILSIGDELLIGDTVNTNASRIGAVLTETGLNVDSVRVVGDDAVHMRSVVLEEWKRHDVCILTGGLGPTHDDVTKEVLAGIFCSEMRVDEQVREHIFHIFKERDLPVYPANLAQAEIPVCFKPLYNPHGTAPGLQYQSGNKWLFALPGVPHEMIWLLQEKVIPILQTAFPALNPLVVRYLKTAGEAESVLSEQFIGDVSEYLKAGCRLAFLPGPARVMLRITVDLRSVIGNTESEAGNVQADQLADGFKEELTRRCSGLIFSEHKEETLEESLGKLLKQKSLKLCTAESCTGGGLINRLTDIPGSSEYVTGGYIVYSNNLKIQDLGIDQTLIEQYGAVSKEVVLAMTSGALLRSGADVAIALSGVAGPGGGTKEKPVGLVWLGIQTPEEHFALRLMLTRDRLINKERSIMIAMETLRRALLGIDRMPYGLEKQN